jgi:hypothetical protein
MERLEAKWTVGKLKLLGNALRDGAEPSSGLPDYDEVMLFYNEAAVQVEEEIDRQDWGQILGELRPRVASRAKSIDLSAKSSRVLRRTSFRIFRTSPECGLRRTCPSISKTRSPSR